MSSKSLSEAPSQSADDKRRENFQEQKQEQKPVDIEKLNHHALGLCEPLKPLTLDTRIVCAKLIWRVTDEMGDYEGIYDEEGHNEGDHEVGGHDEHVPQDTGRVIDTQVKAEQNLGGQAQGMSPRRYLESLARYTNTKYNLEGKAAFTAETIAKVWQWFDSNFAGAPHEERTCLWELVSSWIKERHRGYLQARQNVHSASVLPESAAEAHWLGLGVLKQSDERRPET